jgi:hypothetical protein
MKSGPSKTVEAIVGPLIPPACREEVLGDLFERYTSPLQYGLDALSTVPLVIASRVRRTSDPQVRLMQAVVLYLSFLSAVWFEDGAFLYEHWGLARLVLPAAMTLLGLTIADCYAKPVQVFPVTLVRGLVFGLGFAYLSQAGLWAGSPDLAIPGWSMFYGSAVGAFLVSALRILFPPATEQPLGASAPAFWLELSVGTAGHQSRLILVVKGIAFLLALLAVVTLLWRRG